MRKSFDPWAQIGWREMQREARRERRRQAVQTAIQWALAASLCLGLGFLTVLGFAGVI
jgi:hypothetical protein